MKLRDAKKQAVVAALRLNGTRDRKIRSVERRIGKHHVKIGMDGKWTVVVAGDRVGVAKRATYAKMRDEENVETGIAIAACRL